MFELFAVIEWSTVADQAPEEIKAAVPVALAVVGLFVGIMLAYGVLRRMIGADHDWDGSGSMDYDEAYDEAADVEASRERFEKAEESR